MNRQWERELELEEGSSEYESEPEDEFDRELRAREKHDKIMRGDDLEMKAEDAREEVPKPEDLARPKVFED